jgi:hypothetical protein
MLTLRPCQHVDSLGITQSIHFYRGAWSAASAAPVMPCALSKTQSTLLWVLDVAQQWSTCLANKTLTLETYIRV